MNRLLAAALLSTFLSVSAFAAQSGGWVVDSADDGCFMAASYGGGITVVLIVTRDYNWGISFENEKWNLRKGDYTNVAAYVDGRLIATGKAQHTSATAAVLKLEKAETYRALQLGRVLVLKRPEGELRFALDGTANAMNMVLDCVKSLPAQSTNSAKNSDTTSGYERLSEAEATVILSNLLSSSSYTNFRIAPPSGGDATHFYLADGTSGFMMAYRNSDPALAEAMTASHLKNAAERCAGDFKSGKQVIQSSDGSIVRKVVASCSFGGTTTVYDSTVIRKSDGFLISLTHYYPEGLRDGGASADTEKSGLTDAVMKFNAAR